MRNHLEVAMQLTAYAQRYIAARSIAALYAKSLERTAKQATAACGGSLELEWLPDQLHRLNCWLAAMELEGRHVTAKNKRVMLGVLWRAAHEEGLAPPCGKLRRIKIPRTTPRAWFHSDIRRLIAAGEATTRPRFWRSLFLAYYETGLRISDLLSIERPWLQGGAFCIVQRKTQRTIKKVLSPDTLADIDAMMGTRRTGLIWPLWCCRRQFFRHLRKVIDAAKLPGSSRWLRRAAASYAERDRPGTAWLVLGHARPGLDREAYIDPLIAEPTPIMPPRLLG
jgi:integrase